MSQNLSAMIDPVTNVQIQSARDVGVEELLTRMCGVTIEAWNGPRRLGAVERKNVSPNGLVRPPVSGKTS